MDFWGLGKSVEVPISELATDGYRRSSITGSATHQIGNRQKANFFPN